MMFFYAEIDILRRFDPELKKSHSYKNKDCIRSKTVRKIKQHFCLKRLCQRRESKLEAKSMNLQ